MNKQKTIDDYIAENRRIRKENKKLVLESYSLKEEIKKLQEELTYSEECVNTYKEELFKLQSKRQSI